MGSGTPGATNFLRGDGAWIIPPGYEYDYAQITSPVTVSGTVGAQTTLITGNSVTYDGATPVWIEFSLPFCVCGAADALSFEVWDGATSIGLFAQHNAAGFTLPVTARKKLTPSAAAHTYTLKAYRNTTNGTITVGSGAAGVTVPGVMRITKV